MKKGKKSITKKEDSNKDDSKKINSKKQKLVLEALLKRKQQQEALLEKINARIEEIEEELN